MPATQQDNDERWQLALDRLGEAAQQYQTLIRIVQGGFASLSTEVGTVARQVREQGSDISALQNTQADMQQRLVKLEAESTARRPVLHWLLMLNLANAVGWLAVVGLLVWLVMRLFSLTG